jgi:V/A-type H+-transporting ATPase subunit E
MTGLDKILEDIRQQSSDAVSKTVGDARSQAEAIRQDAEAQAEKVRLTYQQKTEKMLKGSRERLASTAQLRQRQSLLSAKQKIISGILQESLAAAESLPPEQYFAAVIRMASHTAHRGEGVIFLNRKYLGRLPEDFEKQLNDALPDGFSLSVSHEAAAIDSGFLLQYGGIEEDCSFRSVLSARKEELQDKVREILFP